MNNRVRLVTIVAAAVLVAPRLAAHDFWIEPSTFHPEPGSVVSIGLRVGQDFVGDAVRRSSEAIERFYVRQGGREAIVSGIDGADPAGFLRTDGPATAMVVRNALRGGRRSAFLTTLGNSLGVLLWGVVSAMGVSSARSVTADSRHDMSFDSCHFSGEAAGPAA